MAIPLTLRVHRASQLVATKEFHRDIIKIGRLSSAHLCIEDERVSRIHAVIEVSGDGSVSIIDMGSVEGTFVNGKRVSKAPLAHGDAISMGDTRLELLIGAQAAIEQTVAAVQAGEIPAAPANVAVQPANEAVVPAAPEAVEAAPAAAPAAEETAPAPLESAPAPVEAAPPAQPEPAAVAAAPVAPAPAPAAQPEPAQAAPAPAPQPVQAPAGAVATGPQVPSGSVAEAWNKPGVALGRISLPLQRYKHTSGTALPRPVPLPRSLTDRALLLDVRFSWGDQQLAIGTFEAPQQKVTVGSAKETDFQIEAEKLPSDSFPLARQADGGWYLAFTAEMAGELIQDGAVHKLSDLVKAGRARPGDEAGVFEVALPTDAAAWVDLGNIRADLCFRPKPKAAVVPWAERLDYQFLNLFLIAFFAVAGSIVGFTNTAYDADVVQDDLYSNEARWAKTLFEAPKPRTNPFMEKLALKAPKDPGQAAERAKGAEGQMGKRDAPVRNTRSAPRAIDPKDKNEIKNQGILAMLGKGQTAGLSTIFGKGGLGGDLKGAIGGITGNTVGDAHGFGGLGLKGTGPGGGGFGNTIGVGDVGTKGRGGGMGSFGSGVGNLGKKGSADVQISSSEAVIVGYDKELVRRVVHSHHSQLKYCYESELVRNPNMSGKVTISWIIGSGGSVTQASTVASSLGNPKVENCLLARVRSWSFPPPKGGGIAKINYPFVFSPSGR